MNSSNPPKEKLLPYTTHDSSAATVSGSPNCIKTSSRVDSPFLIESGAVAGTLAREPLS